MKKNIIITVLILLVITIMPITNVKAQTIRELENQLNNEQKKLDEINNKKELNKQSIN